MITALRASGVRGRVSQSRRKENGGIAVLYIVATPIGNLEDITLRALRILKEVDIIAAEDTRRTIKLLNHYDIKTKLFSFHEHSGFDKRAQLIDMLKEGKNVALVSDAGTPLISDPGSELVADAVNAGIEVTSVPGACAAVAAYTLSGFSGPFVFYGFLSKKATEKRQGIEAIAASPLPCIIYESPHALKQTLADIAQSCGGERPVVVAKELTKVHENVLRATAAEARDAFSGEVKGEYVIITGGREQEKEHIGDDEIIALLNKKLASGMTKKDAVNAASKELNISKNRVYKLSL
jgi:16S rRNA (cytidine1402-2'-O)-methyltransferase